MPLDELLLPVCRPRQLKPNKNLTLNPKAFFSSSHPSSEATLRARQPTEGILTSILKSGVLSGPRLEPQFDRRCNPSELPNPAFDHRLFGASVVDVPVSVPKLHLRQKSIEKIMPWGAQPSVPIGGPLTAYMGSTTASSSNDSTFSMLDHILGSPLNFDSPLNIGGASETTPSSVGSIYAAPTAQSLPPVPDFLPNPLATDRIYQGSVNEINSSLTVPNNLATNNSSLVTNAIESTSQTSLSEARALEVLPANPSTPNLVKDARLSYQVSRNSNVRLLIRLTALDLGHMLATESSYTSFWHKMSLHSETDFERMSRPRRKKKLRKLARLKIWDLRNSHGFKHKCCLSGCPLQYVGAPSKGSLLRHIDAHHLPKGRVCGWCSFMVCRTDVLKRHIKRRHSLAERERIIMGRVAKLKFLISRNWILQNPRLNPSLRSILKTQLVQGTSLAPSQVGAGTFTAESPSEEENDDDEGESNAEDLEKIQDISAQISEVLPDSGPQAWETRNLPQSLKAFVVREAEASTNAALLLISSPYSEFIRTMMDGTEHGIEIETCESPAKPRRRKTLQDNPSP